MSIVSLLLFGFVFLLIVHYVFSQNTMIVELDRPKNDVDVNTLLQHYYFDNYKNLKASKKQKIFIRVYNERNARKWNDFGGRSSNEMNLDLALLCIQSAVYYLGDDYDIVLYDNTSVGRLIEEEDEEDLCNVKNPSQISGVDLKQWESYCKAKILNTYGGIVMEPCFYFTRKPTMKELFPQSMTICHYTNEGLNVSEKQSIPNCSNWISAPKQNSDIQLYMKYMEYLCVNHYTADHKYFDKTFQKLYSLKYLNPKLIGTMDSQNKPVYTTDLLSKRNIKFDNSLLCLFINLDYLKKYRQHQWILRMNSTQLKQMNNYLGEFISQHHWNRCNIPLDI